MLNTIYQLVGARQFEAIFQDISLNQKQVLVRPTHLSICNADQRYYQGTRPAAVMENKLPMALIHEGIGRVLYDPTGNFLPGTRVVMIPNLPAEQDEYVGENYLPTSRFRGSSVHGLMQEYIQTDADRLLPLPEGLNDLVAVFTEMVSVCYHGISRFDAIAHGRRELLGVWGDGNMGYFTALLLKFMFPDTKVAVFGVNESKLDDFSFADQTFRVDAVPDDLEVDHGFECVGGVGAGAAINQMIRHIKPEGTIALLGVSEDLVPLNTRMILEKGLRFFGTSRSGRADFEGVLELYQRKPQVSEYLERMVGAVVPIRGISQMVQAFELDIHKKTGKTIMIWDDGEDLE